MIFEVLAFVTYLSLLSFIAYTSVLYGFYSLSPKSSLKCPEKGNGKRKRSERPGKREMDPEIWTMEK